MDKNEHDRRAQLRFIMEGWEQYDPELTDEENLIELILYLDFVDDAIELLQRYRRRGNR